jgi:hypothetical protein
MTRTLRCRACRGRIRPSHPRIGIEDMGAGVEFNYHALPPCAKGAARETGLRLVRGRVYAIHHYHAAWCPDEAPGFGCSGGCFSTPMAAAN